LCAEIWWRGEDKTVWVLELLKNYDQKKIRPNKLVSTIRWYFLWLCAEIWWQGEDKTV
jgi:hypothetical protein